MQQKLSNHVFGSGLNEFLKIDFARITFQTLLQQNVFFSNNFKTTIHTNFATIKQIAPHDTLIIFYGLISQMHNILLGLCTPRGPSADW